MWNIFKSEFARYRLYAWLVCVGQIMLWVMVARIRPILEPGSTKNVLLMLSVVFAGFTLALLSMTINKRKSQWAYLVHRPLAIEKIHLAVSLAGLTLLCVGFVLPFTAVVLFLDLFTHNVVEMRHYLYCLHMLLVAAMAYFCGTFAVLTPGKGAYIAIWSVTFMILRQSNPVWFDLLVDVAFVAVGYYVARCAFKVDLSTFNDSKTGLVVSALILQPALMVILVLSQGLYYHIPLMAMGAHPDDDPTRNAYSTFKHKEVREQFSTLLLKSEHPKAIQFNRQLELAEFEGLTTRNQLPSLKYQLFVKDNDFGVVEPDTDILWVFSHTQMLFSGRTMETDEFKGYFGPKGFIASADEVKEIERFGQVPRLFGANLVAVGNRLLEVDFKRKEVRLKHQISEGDRYVATPVIAFDKVWLKSEKRLYVVDQTDFMSSFEPVEAKHVIPFPVNTALDVALDFTEVPDGFLVQFASRNYHGYAKGGASLLFVPHESNFESLASIRFDAQQVPDWIYFQQFMLSPVVMNMVEGALGTILQFRPLPPEGERFFWQQSHSRSVYWLSLLLAVFSTIATWLVATRRGIVGTNKSLWTGLNLVLSLPGFIAFMLLTNNEPVANQSRS